MYFPTYRDLANVFSAFRNDITSLNNKVIEIKLYEHFINSNDNSDIYERKCIKDVLNFKS